ncbi:MAG TPA: GIY-YIG nuclease family protein [Chitinophagaceae bacterium]|nr:GIY-YIG nuclease family protein [Chitinophagaceae bacterium]
MSYKNTILFTVYALSDNGKIFYVGRTTNPNKRLKKHILKHGEDLQMIKLHVYLDSPLPFLHKIDYERFYINQLLSQGHNLINKNKLKLQQ